MKSDKARLHLCQTAMTPNSRLAQEAGLVWGDTAIIKAIELAEQEAEERVRAELTRWHSEVEHPVCGKSVLIKCKSGSTGRVFYAVGYHSGDEWCDKGVLITHYDSVIGWREIHEQPQTDERR